MNVVFDMLDPRPFFKKGDAFPTLMLLSASIIPTIHHYVGSIEFAEGTLHLSHAWSIQYMFVVAALLFGLVPMICLRIFGETIRSFGLGIGDWRMGLKFTAWIYPVLVLVTLLPGAFTPELKAFYPLDKEALYSVPVLCKLEISRLILFYSAWEFFFRGFLLFGLRRYIGDWFAICLQVIPSALWHLGMPASEIGSSILAGVCFGMITLRTGSILWALLLHFLIGTGTDILIVLFS